MWHPDVTPRCGPPYVAESDDQIPPHREGAHSGQLWAGALRSSSSSSVPRRDGGANPTQRWSRTARRQPVQRRGSSPVGEVTTLSQVPGARDKAERAERAVVAHSNMTSAEAARRSTVLVSEQRLAHAATAAGASARRRSAGTAGPDELEVSCGRSRVQAAQPHRLFLAVRRRRGAQILRSRHRTH